MIYTVTFNPSLDYSIRINDFAFGGLNRIGEEAIRVGGKGVNVSFLIKPNLIELGEIFGRSLTDYDDIVGCAMHLQEEGARNVLVSMGADGAILVTENGQVFSSPAPKADDLSQELVDVNGAGDAMVAGFLAGYLERHSMVDGFAKGLAAGSATVYTSGLADKQQINLVAQRK